MKTEVIYAFAPKSGFYMALDGEQAFCSLHILSVNGANSGNALRWIIPYPSTILDTRAKR